MSSILLERNSRSSSGKQTRHISIRYFFVADRIKKGELCVAYCPTEEMVADFYTKPLQGRLFRKLRNVIMGLPPETEMNTEVPPQECVGTRKWSEVICTGLVRIQQDNRTSSISSEKNGFFDPHKPESLLSKIVQFLKECVSFRDTGKEAHISVGYHYTSKEYLPQIRELGLLTRKERQLRGIHSRNNGSRHGDGIYTVGVVFNIQIYRQH